MTRGDSRQGNKLWRNINAKAPDAYHELIENLVKSGRFESKAHVIRAALDALDSSKTSATLFQTNPNQIDHPVAALGLTDVVYDPQSRDWRDALNKPMLMLQVRDLLKFLKVGRNAEYITRRMYNPDFRTNITTDNYRRGDESISDENRIAFNLIREPCPSLPDINRQIATRFRIELWGSNYPFFLMNDERVYVQMHHCSGIDPEFAFTFGKVRDGAFFDTWMALFDKHFTGNPDSHSDYFHPWMRGEFQDK